MGEAALNLVYCPEFGDGDGEDSDILECDCGNTLLQLSADMQQAWCPLCGNVYEADND